MSTRHCTLKDAKDPKLSLGFETNLGGCKFVFEEEGTEEVRKFWFDEQSWEKLKKTVDAYCL